MNNKPLSAKALSLLRELIAIPSISRDESRAADFLQQYMESEGLETKRSGHNLWSITPAYDEHKPTLLLNAHIDTVKPVNGWRHDPFTPTMEDGKLFGLGSNDDGASVVCLLHVFLALHKAPLPYNLIFLSSCEEEVSGRGGIESVLPLLPHIDFAIVGEPTGLQPAIAEKGLMVLDVSYAGVSGHAARDEGENAIYKALDDIAWFRDYRFPKSSALLGPVKMSVTVIHAGTQHNVVPDRCTLTVDVRSNECYTNREIYEEVCRHISGEAVARSFRLGSSGVSPDHPMVKRAVALGLTPFGSPTLSDQALMPFPSMKIGPGQSSRSHTADEFVRPEELEAGIELYLKLLQTE